MQKISTLVCSAPGSLDVEQRDAPVCQPGEAIVRPRRVGICGTDYHIYEGKHPFLSYPRIMGHELAVEIVSAPESSGFAPGETCTVNPYIACGECRTCRAGKRNCCEQISVLGVHQDGGMTELLAVPASSLVEADGLSLDACAAVEFLSIGAHSVRRAAPGAGDKVLIVGAGPIGLGTALFARLSGAEVSITDLDDARAERVADLAGVAVIATEGREEFDYVFDATGSRSAMEASFDYVASGGTYTVVGVVRERISFSAPDFHRREMTLLASRNALEEDFDRVISAIRDEEVDVDRILTHRTTLAEAARDIRTWVSDKSGLIKAMIVID